MTQKNDVKVTVSLPRELRDAVATIAQSRGVSFDDLVAVALATGMEVIAQRLVRGNGMGG